MLAQVRNVVVDQFQELSGHGPMTAFGSWVEALPRLTGFTVTCSGPCEDISVVVRSPSLCIFHEILLNMSFHIWAFGMVPRVAGAFCVVENCVMNRPEPFYLSVSAGSSPHDFIAEAFWTKHRIE